MWYQEWKKLFEQANLLGHVDVKGAIFGGEFQIIRSTFFQVSSTELWS